MNTERALRKTRVGKVVSDKNGGVVVFLVCGVTGQLYDAIVRNAATAKYIEGFHVRQLW